MPRSPSHSKHARTDAAPRRQFGLASSVGSTLLLVALFVIFTSLFMPQASVLPPLIAGAVFIAGQLFVWRHRR